MRKDQEHIEIYIVIGMNQFMLRYKNYTQNMKNQKQWVSSL